jgi:hypothetical protein
MLRSRASALGYLNLLVHFLQARYFVDLWPNVVGLGNRPENYFQIEVLLYEFIGLSAWRRSRAEPSEISFAEASQRC